MDCGHKHLRFGDGSFLLQCIDCGQKWAAVNDRNMPDYTAKAHFIMPPHNTRHDRWELPRTEKQPEIKATVIKKKL